MTHSVLRKILIFLVFVRISDIRLLLIIFLINIEFKIE